MVVASAPGLKSVIWIGSSKADVRTFPEEVKDSLGFALYVAQQGGKHTAAKPLRGFGGGGVLEIIEDHQGDTYRAVYTCGWLAACTCSTPSRRNRSLEFKHRKRRST